MKLINALTVGFVALVITACNSVKKTAATPVTSPAPKTQTEIAVVPAVEEQKATPDPKPVVTFSPIVSKPTGIKAPGEAELNAIKLKYQDVNMQTLVDGHELYTGICTNCHEAQNIYSRDVAVWPGIIDEMALHAELTGVEKDATLKYVLAIKATQPEWVKY